ncbi:MAG: hypothetical protein IJY47_07090 [Clostridia bacterium]|nr:hypothetical protein [Clostridia bacterium]
MRLRRSKGIYILILFFVLMLARVFSLSALASTERNQEDMPKGFSEWVEAFPEDLAQLLPEGMDSQNSEEAGEATLELMRPETLLSIIGELLNVGVGDAFRLFVKLVGLLLIASVFGALRASISSDTVSGAVHFCTTLAIFAAIIGLQAEHLERVAQYLERLSALVGAMIPVTGAVWAMGGNVTTASAGTATLSVFLTVCESLCAKTVIPVCGFCTAMALCNTLSPELGMRGVAGAVKKTYTFLLGMIMTVLVASLGSQTALTAAADSTTARTAKVIASAAIPVVGGSVGDTLRTVASGVRYLKTILGIGGIGLILLLTLPTLLSLILTRVVFLLCGGIADLLGCEREGRLLGELGTMYGCMIAVVSMSAVMFILALWIFVKSVVAVA